MEVQKLREKLATVGMIVFIMLGVSGCMDRHEKNNEEMLAHMKEKYGVEFEIQNYIPRNVDCSYDVWFCNAVGDDPEQDRIEVHRYYGDLAKDGEYADEYYSRLVRDEVESRATEALLQVTEDAKVYLSHFSFAEEEYTEVEQLDEYLQTDTGKCAFPMLIFMVDRNIEKILNQDTLDDIQHILLEAEIGTPSVRIFLVKNQDLFNQIERDTYLDMIDWHGEKKIYNSDYSGNIARKITY